MATSLEPFIRDLLSHHGAIVEPSAHGLDVVAGPALAAELGLSEYQRLVFTPEADAPDAPDAMRVDYDAPLLERMGRLVNRLGRIAFVECPAPPLKPIDAAAQIERGLALQNGVARVGGCEPAASVCVCVFFEYELLADEREGGLTRVWINPDTRSVPRLTAWPAEADLIDQAPPVAAGPMLTVPWAIGLAAARAAIAPTIDDFLERLARRRDRDARRLREYSLDIDQAIRAKLARSGASEDARRRERDRLDATWRSYRTRLDEVADRYRLRVRLVPRGVLACVVPGYHIAVRLMRRTATSDVIFSWNAIDARVDTRCCDGCHAPAPTAWLCDDRVHYLCGRCFAACAHCGKAYCRACHRTCPRPSCERDRRNEASRRDY